MVNLIVLFGLLAIVGLIAGYTLRTGVSPMPTRKKTGDLMFALIPDGIAGTIYELGSGWGTLALPLAKRFPACRVVGYELSPIPWMISRLRQILTSVPNLTLRREDFFDADFSDASLIVCYLYPNAMTKLKDKFDADLKPGALVLCHFFAVAGWRPVEERAADDLHRSRVYLYRIGET